MATYQQEAFPCHPPDGQHCLAFNSVVISAVEAATHAKIRDLDCVQVSDEAVPRRQITMYHVQRLQVLHPGCDLCCHVDQAAIAGKVEKVE